MTITPLEIVITGGDLVELVYAVGVVAVVLIIVKWLLSKV